MGKKDKQKNKLKEDKKGKGKKTVLIIILILLIIAGIVGYKVYKNGGGLKGLLATAVGHDEETVNHLDKIYCLILGQSQNLTDTIILASYDPKNQEASMLSIPRDTFIGEDKSQATSWDKINALYQTDPQQVVDAVKELTGINVKHYLMVDTDALKVLVDAVGGVTFDVPIDMKYTDRKQDLYINLKKGVQKLNGDQAEQLVRFRHNSDGSTYPEEYGTEDIGRMRTQRAFLTALAKQILKPENILKINNFIDIAKKNVETNLNFNTIKDYVPYAVELNIDNLKTAVLPGVPEYANIVWIYSHDKEETEKLVGELFLGIDPTKANTNIEVLNGTSNSENLSKVVDKLEEAGYTISNTGNTSSTSKTTIINRANVEIQEDIKTILGVGDVSSGDPSEETDITIIIGEDYNK